LFTGAQLLIARSLIPSKLGRSTDGEKAKTTGDQQGRKSIHHGITLDEMAQEQPTDKDRAQHVSRKDGDDSPGEKEAPSDKAVAETERDEVRSAFSTRRSPARLAARRATCALVYRAAIRRQAERMNDQ
jgi:hypothetical protein